jgi:hypothetical protein
MNDIPQTITWQVVADIIVGIAVPTFFLTLFFLKRLGKRELLFWLWSMVIGAAFELTVFIFIPNWLMFKMYWPMPYVTIAIWHTLWDGGLFMAGFFAAALVTRKPAREVCTRFDIGELAVMVVWGAVSAFVVEFIGNGIIWEYLPQRYNPVWITIGDQGYTAFIQIVWLIVPFIFYFGCLFFNTKIRTDS